MKRIDELDGLRFVAIAAVFAVHYRPPFNPHYWSFGLGWMGVDLFFAISGFLITTILIDLRKKPHAFRLFYGRRILRIFPPYYLVLAILLLISVTHAGPGAVPLRRALGAITFTSSFNPPPFVAVYNHVFHHTALTTEPLPLDNHVLSTSRLRSQFFGRSRWRKSSIYWGLRSSCSARGV